MGLLAGRLWVSQPARAGARPRAADGGRGARCASRLLQLFHYPAPFGELMVHVILPQALYNGFLGAALRAGRRGRREPLRRRVVAPEPGDPRLGARPGAGASSRWPPWSAPSRFVVLRRPALVPAGARGRPAPGDVGEEPHPHPPGRGAPRHPLRPERPRRSSTTAPPSRSR